MEEKVILKILLEPTREGHLLQNLKVNTRVEHHMSRRNDSFLGRQHEQSSWRQQQEREEESEISKEYPCVSTSHVVR